MYRLFNTIEELICNKDTSKTRLGSVFRTEDGFSHATRIQKVALVAHYCFFT